jgi:inosine-uridine nucleoside N-ribohydrolase
MANYTGIAFNGTLVLDLGDRAAHNKIFIMGGPFDTGINTADTWNINLKAEGTRVKFDAELPIRDFDVPSDYPSVKAILEEAIEQALAGRILVVGCAGGMGRTGLFLALLAKAVGIRNPVAYVRANYYRHAVETPEQQAYVDSFDVAWAPMFIRRTYLALNAVAPPLTLREAPVRVEPATNPSFWQTIANWWNANIAR